MRRILNIMFGISLMSFLSLSGKSTAQSQNPPDIESRFNLNTYTLTSTPEDGYVLEHAEVLKSLQFGFEVLAQIDDDPLTWQRESEEGGYEETEVVVERLFLLHAGASIGFFDYSQLAVHVPVYLDRGTTNSIGGISDLRFVPKGAYRFEALQGEIGLAFFIPITAPIGDEERLLGEGVVSIAPSMAADMKLGKLRVVFNTGYSWREKEKRDLLRGSEWLVGLGAEFDLLNAPGNLRALVELDVATQVGDFFGRASTPVCLLGGLKYRFESGFGLGASLGAGLAPGVGAPDFRVVFSGDYVYQKKLMDKEPELRMVAADADGDGIRDADDRCPDKLEDFDKFEDDDGCPEIDNDGDGIPDAKDECPIEAENINGMDDRDGCPDFDGDEDGISDKRDKCPIEIEDLDGFEDRDGCPDTDNDIDGLKDTEDNCPNLPESINNYQDDDGCPDYFNVVDNEIIFKRRIRFMRASADLMESAYDVLDELAMAIIANPSWEEVHISVHTSGRGRNSVKQALSEERARTLMRILVAGGVIPERLIAMGRGNSEPLSPPNTPEGRKKNQRVEIEIVRGEVQ
ncbi:MAG: OmpA family protein [Proteobacteria bacterium]|nr:OmpA family protein [Pseudomonadota bacterium]